MALNDRGALSDLLAGAKAAWKAARYGKALAMLDGYEEWPEPERERAAFLQTYLRAIRNKPVEALELLARTQDLYTSPQGLFLYHVASMRAYIGTRSFEAAATMAQQAEPHAGAVDATDRTLLYYHRAQLRWCQEKYDPDDPDIAALIAGGDPNGRFLGLMMRGYMRAGLGRYLDQAQDLSAACAIAAAHPGTCDPGIVVLQVHALLRLGLELGDQDVVEAGRRAYDAVPWNEELDADRFLCTRAMAWCSFLRGDAVQAQWLLREAKEYATSDAWRVIAHLDRAYIARTNGNEPWAIDELHAAHAVARTVEWSATRGEERQALVMLAALFAPVDMARAQRYVSLYQQIGRDSIDPTLQLARDQRALAFEKYSLGRVQHVLGNDALASASYEAAYQIFTACNYRFRASLAALGLYELTAEERWLERARAEASIYQQSALYAVLTAKPTQADTLLRGLSPMQRQVAFAICEGLEVGRLSHRFSRSAFTMQQIVASVFEQAGARNRNELRAALKDWVAA